VFAVPHGMAMLAGSALVDRPGNFGLMCVQARIFVDAGRSIHRFGLRSCGIAVRANVAALSQTTDADAGSAKDVSAVPAGVGF